MDRLVQLTRWLGTALDGQTDSVKKNRIRLSGVSPSAVRLPGTRSTARQISKKDRVALYQKNRIRLSVVNPSSVRWLGTMSKARQISQKEQNSSVRRRPVLSLLARTALDGQTDSVKKNRIRLSIDNPSAGPHPPWIK
jgi:hypothetical protein